MSRAVGLDPKSVTSLIAGAEPRRTTRVKLSRWYMQEVAAGLGSTDQEVALYALGVLLRDVREEAQQNSIRQAVSALRRIYVESRSVVPEWLRHLDQPEPG